MLIKVYVLLTYITVCIPEHLADYHQIYRGFSFLCVCVCVCICMCFSNNFFEKNIYFSCRTIFLQHCGGPCRTSTWISHRCTCVPASWNSLPHPSPPHPSVLSQSTGFECSASCIELALVICFTYGNTHVSMLFSHIIPASPSPT